MKGTPLEDPRNGKLGHSGCMDCRKPMHEPLCGTNWNERDSSLNLPYNLFSKTMAHANTVIYALCIHNHQPAWSDTVSTTSASSPVLTEIITLDNEDDDAAGLLTSFCCLLSLLFSGEQWDGHRN